MVGGGNYIEYQNLMELAQSKGGGGISSPSAANMLSPGKKGCGENVSKPRSETSLKPRGIKPRSVYTYV